METMGCSNNKFIQLKNFIEEELDATIKEVIAFDSGDIVLKTFIMNFARKIIAKTDEFINAEENISNE